MLPGVRPAAEAIVLVGFDRVDRDGDALDAALDHLPRHPVVDQHAVGAHHHPEAAVGGGAGDVVDVLAQERLAAGQDEHLGAQELHLGDESQAFVGGELVVGLLAAFHVAVRAAQVAAPGEVPGDQRRTGGGPVGGSQRLHGCPSRSSPGGGVTRSVGQSISW